MKIKRFADNLGKVENNIEFWYETESNERFKCDKETLKMFYIEWLTDAGSFKSHSENWNVFEFHEPIIFNI